MWTKQGTQRIMNKITSLVSVELERFGVNLNELEEKESPLKLDIIVYKVQVKKIKFKYPYTVTDVGSMRIKNPWTMNHKNPIKFLHHSQEHKVYFFTLLYN